MSEDYKTLSQNLAVKSLMGEFNAANGYGLIGSSMEQTANLDNTDLKSGENKKAKDAELMLFLDEIQRLDQDMRDSLKKIMDLQNDMKNLLDDMETDVDNAKTNEVTIQDYIKAYADKDVDKMTEFMLASGLFDEAEIDAMKENGSFAKAYEEFVEDAIDAQETGLEKIAGYSSKYNETRTNILNAIAGLEKQRDLANAAGRDTQEINENIQEQQNLLDANDTRYNGIIQKMADTIGVDKLRETLKEHSLLNKGDLAFGKISRDVLDKEFENEIVDLDAEQEFEESFVLQNNNAGSGLDF